MVLELYTVQSDLYTFIQCAIINIELRIQTFRELSIQFNIQSWNLKVTIRNQISEQCKQLMIDHIIRFIVAAANVL